MAQTLIQRIHANLTDIDVGILEDLTKGHGNCVAKDCQVCFLADRIRLCIAEIEDANPELGEGVMRDEDGLALAGAAYDDHPKAPWEDEDKDLNAYETYLDLPNRGK